jgi:hypothetical protein
MEAYGQTQAFSLTAGSTAGWDAGAVVTQAPMTRPAPARLSLAPNPSRSVVTFAVTGQWKSAAVSLYTIAGKRVRHWELKGNSTLSASGLGDGLYIVRLSQFGRNLQTNRFVVMR